MTNEELDRLEELEKAATPGPWYCSWGASAVDDDTELSAALRNAARALIAAARENSDAAAKIAELERRLALAVAEVRAVRENERALVKLITGTLAEDPHAENKVLADKRHAIDAARAATDADPMLKVMIGGEA